MSNGSRSTPRRRSIASAEQAAHRAATAKATADVPPRQILQALRQWLDDTEKELRIVGPRRTAATRELREAWQVLAHDYDPHLWAWLGAVQLGTAWDCMRDALGNNGNVAAVLHHYDSTDSAALHGLYYAFLRRQNESGDYSGGHARLLAIAMNDGRTPDRLRLALAQLVPATAAKVAATNDLELASIIRLWREKKPGRPSKADAGKWNTIAQFFGRMGTKVEPSALKKASEVVRRSARTAP